MKTNNNKYLQIGLAVACLFATASSGCIATDATDEPSGAIEAAATALPPIGCIRGEDDPNSPFQTCYYDAPELSYSDGWKCTPPGDLNDGRCKTTIVGKSVSFTFFTATAGFGPGIHFTWRVSAAQGSVRVVIDGVDRGLVWQGECSTGFKAYSLNEGFHTIKLIKPARDGDRAISIRYFGTSD